MARRIPASRTREALAALIEGRLASSAGRSELVELATRIKLALPSGYPYRGSLTLLAARAARPP